jgi:hypothetical protein
MLSTFLESLLGLCSTKCLLLNRGDAWWQLDVYGSGFRGGINLWALSGNQCSCESRLGPMLLKSKPMDDGAGLCARAVKCTLLEKVVILTPIDGG